MKRKYGIVALILALIMSLTACVGNKPDDKNNGNSDNKTDQTLVSDSHLYANGLHKVSVTANANRKFIENGNTDYKIVYADGDHGKRAAEFLVKQAFAASGAYINAIPASEYDKTYESTDKLIVIGVDTLFTAAGLTMPEDDIGITGALSASLTCLGNVGPGLYPVGPTGSFAALSGPSKLVLTANMLLGRLEVLPLLVLLFPSMWKKR